MARETTEIIKGNYYYERKYSSMKEVMRDVDKVDFTSMIENKKIEFKVELNKNKPIGWLKTVVGYANDRGGIIYIGVSDEGYPKGFYRKETDEIQLYMVDMMKRRIDPPIEYDIELIKIKERFILKLIIEESKINVVSYVDRKNDITEIYIRKHGSTTKANLYDMAELFLRKNPIPFDERVSEEQFENHTFHSLNEKYKELNNTMVDLSQKKMQALGLFNEDGLLTNAGLLFVDKRKEEFPLIHMRKWPGFDKGSDEVIDRKEFRGNLIDQLNNATLFIRNNIKTGFVKLPIGRVDKESYPMRAVVEALCNAIAHRDYLIGGTQIDIDIYQDRMVITSPGDFLPIGNASEYVLEEIPSKRRNETVCNILSVCKLMEKSGSGFEKIVKEYNKFDKKYAPRVISRQDYFMIVLKDVLYDDKIISTQHTISIEEMKLPKNQKLIYDVICENPGLRVPDISSKSGLKKSSVDNAIRELKNKEIIKFVGTSKGGGYYKL